ncbi:PHP domain protein [Desulfurobacterium thermolithotrophum DSM 11699]|uniref:DNA polymerase beta n=1 Tax=Desulfurobacterium thermolithotrophum (strain DSM 11699 / BSA) TaxID=868864 RepID=F0S2W6_DESTD|nr:DNA polymerase/3'-5' exonuclease PolX [Desulfurobacterium thermolithotrophum]ADY73188.1 PHP domain protein [Desulfurobacterium thermolithotrophum DSM 11699]
MKNKELANLFDEWADILEFKEDNPYHIRAYRNAARLIRDLSEDIEILAREGKLLELPGIGQKLQAKIIEFLKTGKIEEFEKLKQQVPDTIFSLLDIPGVGPKTVKLLYETLGIRSVEDLKRAIEKGELLKLPGFGLKKVEKIKKGIELLEKNGGRILLGVAVFIADRIINLLKEHSAVERISVAGSTRRMKETVGDIDILATGKNLEIIEAFVNLPNIKEVLWKGTKKATVIVEEGEQVDLRVTEPESYGAALQYFTGSKAHNIHLRTICLKQGYKLNEYGLFKEEEKIAGKTEEEIYKALGMETPPPEIREDTGEIEAALEHKLPNLIDYKDIKGDLHIHSNWSDGVSTIEEIALKALKMGYKYIAITDHSKSLKVANGLSEEDVLRRNEEIDKLNEKFKGKIRILKGMEVDILPDGSLDYDNEILSQLDFVVAAIHSRFTQDNTERIIKAMENPYVNAIAHPTGRLIGQREGYPLDIEAIMKKAAETGTALEVNAYYNRLDLKDIHCRLAVKFGVKLVISTDSHHVDHMWMIKLGVGTARRGWVRKEDVINTKNLKDLQKFLKEKRRKFGTK